MTISYRPCLVMYDSDVPILAVRHCAGDIVSSVGFRAGAEHKIVFSQRWFKPHLFRNSSLVSLVHPSGRMHVPPCSSDGRCLCLGIPRTCGFAVSLAVVFPRLSSVVFYSYLSLYIYIYICIYTVNRMVIHTQGCPINLPLR